jgi:release factor glutamine methyltransferase
VMEVGAGQAGDAAEALRAAGLREVGHRDDLAGVARVVGGRAR